MNNEEIKERETGGAAASPAENGSNLKKAISLFFFFAKIGCFTFGGGWSILAQMEREFIDKRHVITKSDVVEMVAVGKSVPGLMITNICVIFGYQYAGYLGAVCSVLGIAFPAIVILTIVTFCYDAVKSNYWCAAILKGISCAVPTIIGSACLSLGLDVWKKKSGILITLLAFPICQFTKINNLVLVLVGAAAGLIWMEVHEHVTVH